MRGAWAGHVVGARLAGERDVRHRSMRGGLEHDSQRARARPIDSGRALIGIAPAFRA
ncbi:hypothetical protein L506_0566 [Bordetella bronchiseptica GA96-01]|nr:hypothetical protein L572_0620 [Bordetella bronchiseptica 345]KDC38609.1 hypothetical protein L506_0566 [Bordetella bronchiseptica GA96-01]